MNSALSYPRFRTILVTSFALLALALALVGVYGVLSYLVAERTPEIGVRLALGASRGEIFRHVIGGSMPPVFFGVIVGLAVAFGVARTFQAVLFDVSATDPVTAASAVGVLLFASLGASCVPALRAASLDPHVALRQE